MGPIVPGPPLACALELQKKAVGGTVAVGSQQGPRHPKQLGSARPRGSQARRSPGENPLLAAQAQLGAEPTAQGASPQPGPCSCPQGSGHTGCTPQLGGCWCPARRAGGVCSKAPPAWAPCPKRVRSLGLTSGRAEGAGGPVAAPGQHIRCPGPGSQLRQGPAST